MNDILLNIRFKSYDEVMIDELQRSVRFTIGAFSLHFYKTETYEITGERSDKSVAKPDHLKEQC